VVVGGCEHDIGIKTNYIRDLRRSGFLQYSTTRLWLPLSCAVGFHKLFRWLRLRPTRLPLLIASQWTVLRYSMAGHFVLLDAPPCLDCPDFRCPPLPLLVPVFGC
jgi:hypothetical protein